MSSQAVADARLGLLYHSLWDKRVADETFARWRRSDFVALTGVAEGIHAYDRHPNPYEEGVDRVMAVLGVMHAWVVLEQNYRRDHLDWSRGLLSAEPRRHLGQVTDPDAEVTGAPIYEYRRLAGVMLTEGRFASVAAPGKPWINLTTPEQLHHVLQVDANRRQNIAERVRDRQMKAGEHEAAAIAAGDAQINWAPIEATIAHNVATRPTAGM